MTEEEFIVIRDKLISDIRSTPLYQRYKNLNQAIYENEEIIALNNKKDKLIQEYKYSDETAQKKILEALLVLQKQIDQLPIVTEYYTIKEQLKALIQPLNDEIINKIYL